MRRLVIKLCIAAMMILFIIVALHAVSIIKQQKVVDEVYTLRPDQDVLVLGSSEIGCAIVEAPKYHNKVLWVSETSAASQLMRLKELERRNQLGQVKVLIVPFSFRTLMSQTPWNDKWAWFQELAISWRYLDDLPCSKFEFFTFIFSNLRWPIYIHLRESRPERISLAERPKEWFVDFIKSECSRPKDDFVKNLPTGWDARLEGIYSYMSEICQRNNIRFVVLQPPMLPQYEACQLPSTLELQADWSRYLTNHGAEYCVVLNKYDEHDFFDMVHLVKSGSARFTNAMYIKLGLSISEDE